MDLNLSGAIGGTISGPFQGSLRGGVRLRSGLSPGGGRNQKGHFKAKTGTFFIDSYKLGAYYIKSYKKWTKRLKILKSHNLQWELGLK